MKNFYSHFLSCCFIAIYSLSNAQITYTFTNAGATGRLGPSQAQVDAAYSSTNLAGQVTSNGGIQEWTVPATGSYLIEARGAQGGGAEGGKGAIIIGEFSLNGGDVIQVLVGQKGGSALNDVHTSGGGGSYVIDQATNGILVIAGGGGGASSLSSNADGTVSQNGQDAFGSGQGLGGINGNGGDGATCRGGGGAGWVSNGLVACCACSNTTSEGGYSFANGGQGGSTGSSNGAEGGFGGGGATDGTNTSWLYAGGGGGYSGGAGSSGTGGIFIAGGGGSYNSGTNQVNTSGGQTGDGLVIITQLVTYPNDAGIADIVSPALSSSDCAGEYDVEVVLQNYGSNQVTGVTVGWSINGVAQTPTIYSSTLDTAGGSGASFVNLILGTVTINSPTTIQVWSSMPNGVVDTLNFNDTAMVAADTIYDPQLDLGPDVALCPGESVVLGGYDTNSYETYEWNTGSDFQYVSANSVGTFVLTVTQGPCESVDTVEVYQGSMPNVDLGNNFSSCGPTTLNAGNPGSTYEWETGQTTQTINVSVTGNYEVTVTSTDGCSASDDVTINVNPIPEFDLGEDLELCVDQGENAQISVTGNFASYLWSNGSMGNTITVGAPTTLSGPQTFTVTVTNAFVCSATDDITVDYKMCIAVGMAEVEPGRIEVFPNPATSVVTIQLPENLIPAELKLYDPIGREVVFSQGAVVDRSQLKIDVTGYVAGVYTLKATIEGRSLVKKILITPN